MVLYVYVSLLLLFWWYRHFFWWVWQHRAAVSVVNHKRRGDAVYYIIYVDKKKGNPAKESAVIRIQGIVIVTINWEDYNLTLQCAVLIVLLCSLSNTLHLSLMLSLMILSTCQTLNEWQHSRLSINIFTLPNIVLCYRRQ